MHIRPLWVLAPQDLPVFESVSACKPHQSGIPEMGCRTDRFFLEEGCIKGSSAIVVAAKDTRNGNQNCMCKFITSPVDYTRELQLHDMLPEDPSPIPGIASPHSLAAR